MAKSILITGGSSGIGRAATALFAANGYTVFSTYRNAADRDALAAIPGVRPIELDVTGELDRAFETIADAVGDEGLYAIVNNAGITHATPFEFAKEDVGRQVLEVNLMAPFRIAQRFLPLLARYSDRHAVRSRIVNVASWAGAMGQPFIPFYNASKFALVGMSESMFYDLDLLGVHVVLANPGITKTPLLAKTTHDATASLQRMPGDRRARYLPLLTHYAALSAQYGQSSMARSAETVARKLFRVVERERPAFKYNLSPDAYIVDRFIAPLMPWCVKVAMNRRMFRLDQRQSVA